MLTGLAASGLVGLFSPFVRFLLLFLLFSVLSGDVIRSLIWDARALPGTVRLPLAFLLGASLYSVVGWVCAVAGLSFSVYTVVVQGVAFVLFGSVFLAVRRSGAQPVAVGAGDRLARRVVLLAAFATAVLFYLLPPRIGHVGDSYDHIGYVRAIAVENKLFPDGVLAPEVGEPQQIQKSDPRKGTFHPLLAAIARLAELEPVVLWPWLAIILAPMAVLAFFAFARSLLPGPGYALGAMVLFFMFQGGMGNEFLARVTYGQHFALFAYWTLTTLALDFGRRPDAGKLFAIMLILVGGTFVHFDVLVHFGLLVTSLIVFFRVFSWQPAALLRLAVASVVCATAVLAWKLSSSYQPGNAMHTHPQGLLYFFDVGDPHFVASPVEILKKNGLLFLFGLGVVPLLPMLRRHRRSAMMCLALSVPPLLIAMNPWVAPLIYARGAYLLHRFVLNVPAYVITVLVLGSLVAWARAGGLLKKALAIVLLFMWSQLFVLASGGWTLRAKAVHAGGRRPPSRVEKLADFMSGEVAAGSVVLSDPVTSYALTAYTDVKVVGVLHQHGTPNDPRPFDRLHAIRAVLSPYTSQREALQALEKYDVDYVVVNGGFSRPVDDFLAAWDPADTVQVLRKLDGMAGRLETVYKSDGITMYAVREVKGGRYEWFPTLPFLRKPDEVLSACNVQIPAQPIRVTGVSIRPGEALPGEQVRLTVAYRRQGRPLSDLPLKLYIRLEDREYFSDKRCYPGDKYVRRFVERRELAFRRYRFDHVPFRGLLTPDMWPLEKDIYETITLLLPTDLREAVYDVELKLVYDTLIANFAWRDFVYNDDSYEGTVCTQLVVSKFLTR